MKIGILGAGNVGSTLGAAWQQKGHEVLFGVRKPGPDSPQPAATLEEAAQFGEVLLLSVPWPAVEPLLRGLPGLEGKVLLDATNPLLPDLSGLTLGTITSAAETIQQWAPASKVVKIFNTVGNNIMGNPRFNAKNATMLFCSDDADAAQTANALALEIGFEPLNAGPLKQARLLEPFALLWISLALERGLGREFAFLLTRR